MRALLMTTAEKGHLNPMVGVAQHLLRAGHRVGWLTIPEPAPQLDGLGVHVLRLPHAAPPPDLVTGGEDLARLVADAARLRDWIRTLLLDAVPGQVDPVRAVVRGFRPDVIGVDGMLYQGVIAARLEGVPFAGISSALTLLEPPGLDFELIRTVRGLAADRAALFARYGLEAEFRTCECLSPVLNVIFATEALVGVDAPLPPATRLVGPSIPPGARGDEAAFPWDRLRPDAPIVYLSFGSQISWQPGLFTLVAEAAAPLGVQLVISAGDLAESGFGADLPGQVIVARYVPQLQLLARVSAFVSHGGANSVMEGLYHGVPLLLLPVCNDQPVQAHYLGRAGAGLALDRRGLDVAGCRAALAALLDPAGPYVAAARRIRDSYRARDGAAETAAALARLAA